MRIPIDGQAGCRVTGQFLGDFDRSIPGYDSGNVGVPDRVEVEDSPFAVLVMQEITVFSSAGVPLVQWRKRSRSFGLEPNLSSACERSPPASSRRSVGLLVWLRAKALTDRRAISALRA